MIIIKNNTDNDNDKNINYCDDKSNGIIWIERKRRRMSLLQNITKDSRESIISDL